MKSLLALVCVFALASLACDTGPRSGRGLRLPDGDVARGEIAFRKHGCPTCHQVAGGPEYARAEGSKLSIKLGGDVTRVETHGELVTSIVNPSHELSSRYPKEMVADGDKSKMENFNDRMTVAELIDLTAFLQSKYVLRVEPLYLP